MKKFKMLLIALLCVVTVGVIGCKKDADPVAEEFGVSITLPGNNGRTVFYDVTEVSSYTITVLQNDYYVATETGLPGETVSIHLSNLGTYIIIVFGIDSSGTTIASGNASVTFKSESEGYKDVEIDIYPEEKEIGIKAKAVWNETDTEKFTSEDAVRYDVYILEENVVIATYEDVPYYYLLDYYYFVNIPTYNSYTLKIEAKNENLEIVGVGESSFTLSKGETKIDVTVTITGRNKDGSADLGVNAAIFWVEPYKGETIQFGEWPQTIANLTESQISDLTETGKEYDGHKEYSLNDGSKYVKVESAKVYGDLGGDPAYLFSDGNYPTTGNTYYFKVEPINWTIRGYRTKGSKIDKFLVSEKVLTANVSYYGYYWNRDNSTRTIGEKIIYPNNYKYSNIRAYLNSINNQFIADGGTATSDDIDWTGKGFYSSAFSETEKEKIIETDVDNTVLSTHDINGKYPNVCENTKDKIFLLSYKEVNKKNLGFEKDRDRIMYTTDYALVKNASQSTYETPGANWMLRSPSATDDYNENLFFINTVGYGNPGYGTEAGGTLSEGIVPAMMITE